jgi:phosphoserine phosphatase
MSDAPRVPRWLARADQPREFRLTLCGGRDAENSLAELRAALGGLSTGAGWRPGENAWCLDVDCAPAEAWSVLRRLRERLADADVYLQPRDELGKRLLICDMDMTIVAAETLDEVAAMLGLGEKIAAITKRAMHGELDFRAALRERIAMLAGQPEQVFHDIVGRLELNPGAESLLAGARAAGVHTILVSGGFEQVARPVAARLGFDEVHCNRLEIDRGRLTGGVTEPIVDAALKRDILERQAAALGIPLVQCCAIGDGANDLPMLAAAGLGIAYHGKPVLRDATPCRIDHSGLDAALHFMGLDLPATGA